MNEDDPLYLDTYQGFITGHSNGAQAIWELLFMLIGAICVVILAVLYAIVWAVKHTVLFVMRVLDDEYDRA